MDYFKEKETMISLTLKDVLDGNVPDEYISGVYVWIDHNNQVLYVGESLNIPERFSAHMGCAGWKSKSMVGTIAIDNIPLALQWTILLYSIEDCRAYYPARMLAFAIYHPPTDNLIIKMAENALIAELDPCHNEIGKPRLRDHGDFNAAGYAHTDEDISNYLAV